MKKYLSFKILFSLFIIFNINTKIKALFFPDVPDVLDFGKTIKQTEEENNSLGNAYLSFQTYNFYDVSNRDLPSYHLNNIYFSSSNLNRTNFKFSTFNTITFRFCSFNLTDFSFSKFNNVSFKGKCSGKFAKFTAVLFRNNINFSNANLTKATFFKAKFINNINFSNANLTGANFKGCKGIENAIWENANLENAVGLTEEQVEYIKLSGAINVPEASEGFDDKYYLLLKKIQNTKKNIKNKIKQKIKQIYIKIKNKFRKT